MDLNQFALKSISEINELRNRVGAEKFEKFKTAAFNEFKKLKPGDRYNIEDEVSEKNQPSFMKIACLYIMETGWNCNIDIIGPFSNVIRGIQTPAEYYSELSQIRQRIALRYA